MNGDTIDLYKYPRVTFGWAWLSKLNDHLGSSNSEIRLLYLYKTKELLITDEKLYGILKHLGIPYQDTTPSNSMKFLKLV